MKSCLIVDDLDLVRRVVSQMAVKLGFEVSEAESADEALAVCERAMPDLIVLDWKMPGLSAHEFVLALRAKRRGAHPHVIYMTTGTDAADITRMLASGANDFLLKPFARADFEERLSARGVLPSLTTLARAAH